MRKTNEKGFTLVELLVVIAIIALLMGLLIPGLGIVRRNARDTARRTDLEAVKLLLEEHYVKNSKYPKSNKVTASGTDVTVEDISGGTDQTTTLDFQGVTTLSNTLTDCSDYDGDLSPDEALVCYGSSSGEQDYTLMSVMEAGGVFELSPTE